MPIEYGLAEEVLLLVYPILLGKGKRLFSDGTPPRKLVLAGTKAVSSGIVISNYNVSGPIWTESSNDRTM